MTESAIDQTPWDTFTGACCKGSYALNTACGKCERCAWERNRSGVTVGTIPTVYTAPQPPPLGLMPRPIWKAQRVTAIIEAMQRYAAAQKPIPPVWVSELDELLRETL